MSHRENIMHTHAVRLPRRTFLKGAGAAMALPLLDCMTPMTASAAVGGAPAQAPPRMAFIFFPNGAIMPSWKPEGEGENFQLSRTLEPLEKFKSRINVFAGLTQHHARANGDGAGDHARNAGAFLTGAQPRKTSGADIAVGVSIDQAAAALVGSKTPLPSIELGIERGRNAGNCDSGYSCAYSNNISWKTATTPMSKEINPRLAFERLFGSPEDARRQARRARDRQSILDLVAEDVRSLQNRLGSTDRRKLDEYFTSVRELEERIGRTAATKKDVPEYDIPEGVPREMHDHIRLMYDVLALAFQTDTTRIATFMVGNAGSNNTYPMVNVNEGWHHLSHHRDDKDMIGKLARIDRYLIEQFAYFLDKLAAVKEGERTLLENSMILYGSAIADGNRHTHHDLPVVLAGSGGGTIRTGRYVKYPDDTPLNNLFLSMSDRLGAKLDKLGDSSGRLSGLEG
ncbi:MAG: DUF1552 domain-containing protein [Planctomycetes bacterium]|nr:DUF1552 domain-containing protein [Planctomycetota bacterium]